MADKDSNLVSQATGEVFHDLVVEAMTSEAVSSPQETGYYLVTVLQRFVRTTPGELEKVFGVELLKTSNETPVTRYVQLKSLADSSLFLSGIFLDHLESRLPTTEYFFDIGSRAYLDLGSLDRKIGCGEGEIAPVYLELSQHFDAYVRVLSHIADSAIFNDTESRMRLYKAWAEGSNDRYTHRLMRSGVLPVDGEKTRH
jgi:hypothetical protein